MMENKKFIVVGENIHCTRIVKSGGIRTGKTEDGGEGVKFTYKGEPRILPVPQNWAEISPQYKDGKIRHIVLGIYHALKGKTEDDRVEDFNNVFSFSEAFSNYSYGQKKSRSAERRVGKECRSRWSPYH